MASESQYRRRGGKFNVRGLWWLHPLGRGVPDYLRIVLFARSGLRRRSWILTHLLVCKHFSMMEGREPTMYDGGAFGGFTRWAVVFLIIFVLFILLVPYGTATTCTTTPVY